MDEFYDFLRSQFNNLEEAKIYYKKWKNNDQIIKDHPEWEFSLRAMAAHISNVLENKKLKKNSLMMTDYLSTKYGPDIYWC